MTREDIHKFLAEHKDIFSKIEDISKGYKISDFVKVDRVSKEHLLKGTCEIHGCIYEERSGFLRTDSALNGRFILRIQFGRQCLLN